MNLVHLKPVNGFVLLQSAMCISTEPFIKHPKNPDLSRLLTPSEHARVKGIPRKLIDGLSDTIAHEVLGQSVIFPIFEAIGKCFGEPLARVLKVEFTKHKIAA